MYIFLYFSSAKKRWEFRWYLPNCPICGKIGATVNLLNSPIIPGSPGIWRWWINNHLHVPPWLLLLLFPILEDALEEGECAELTSQAESGVSERVPTEPEEEEEAPVLFPESVGEDPESKKTVFWKGLRECAIFPFRMLRNACENIFIFTFLGLCAPNLLRNCDRWEWPHPNSASFFVQPKPVLSVVDRNEVLDELFVRFPNSTTLALLRPKDHVVVERVVHHGVTWKRNEFGVIEREQSLRHTRRE